MRKSAGFSLIETTVAIALVGVIVVSILSAFSATTVAVTRHQQQTALDLLVRSDAEFIKSQPYQASYANLAAAGYTFAVQVLYYNPATGRFAAGNADRGLQEIILTVSQTPGPTEQLDFTKAKAAP